MKNGEGRSRASRRKRRHRLLPAKGRQPSWAVSRAERRGALLRRESTGGRRSRSVVPTHTSPLFVFLSGPPAARYTRVLPRLAATPARASTIAVVSSRAARARSEVVTRYRSSKNAARNSPARSGRRGRQNRRRLVRARGHQPKQQRLGHAKHASVAAGAR